MLQDRLSIYGEQRISRLGNNLPPSSLERPLISVSRDQIEGINILHISCELGTWKKIFFSIITSCDGGHLKNTKVIFDEKTQGTGNLKLFYCKVCVHITSARMLWEWSDTGTGCPGRLQRLHPWWWAGPGWAAPAGPALGRGFGLAYPEMPGEVMLWYLILR